MITTLDKLTAARFIDLACGETSVLDPGDATKDEIAKAVRGIVMEYRSIADKAGAKAYVLSSAKRAKARGAVTLFKMCRNLASLKQYGRVREILTEYGVQVGSMDDRRLNAEVASKLNKAERTLEELAPKGADKTDLRRDFDAQTAVMMAHFKFQIDVTTMPATTYAHLVDQMTRDMDALKKALCK